MDFNKLLEEKKISKYKLSKESGVPYSTICDISTGKSVLLKCSAETVIRIAHILNISAEELVGDISYPANDTKKGTSEPEEKSKSHKSDKTQKSKKEAKSDKANDADKKLMKESGVEKKPKKNTGADKKTKKNSSSNKSKDSDRNIKSENLSQKTKKAEPLDPIKKAYLERKAAREEAYKNYCEDLDQKIKEMGELNFLVSYLKNNEVSILYNLNRKKESKYLLALVDELYVKYNFPLCKEYDEIREDNE